MITGKERIILAIEAYFAAFALADIGHIQTTSIITLVLFFLCFQLFLLAASREREYGLAGNGKEILHTRSAARRTWASAFLGGLYTLFYLSAEYRSLTGTLENRLFRLIFLLMCGAGLFFLFFRCCRLLFLYLGKRSLRISAIRPAWNRNREKKNSPDPFSAGSQNLPIQLCLLLFVILMLCWLPWFLYNFPGVMTPDSLSQYSQAMGLAAASDHHPYVHTLIIRLFLKLGLGVSGSIYGGIAFYTVFQMACMAVIIVYCIRVLLRCGAGKKLCLLFLLFYIWVPYNGIFAVTMWKDILFSGFMLLFALSLYQLILLYQAAGASPREAGQKQPLGQLLLLSLSGLMVCLLRSNGLFVFLLTLPFLLWFFRGRLRILLPCMLLVPACALLIKGPLFGAMGVEKPAFSESVSIPAQQIARVVYEGRELTEEEIDLLNRTVDYASIASYYQPELADPVKALIQYKNPEYLESHKADYLKLWIRLGLKYPLDYWNALVDQTRGYWFPESPMLTVNEGITPNELGLYCQPVLRGGPVWKAAEIICKLYTVLPLYGLLYSIGAFTWTALFLFVNCMLNGRRENLLLFIPFFALLASLSLAAPVASDLRYAYPLILAMPLLIHAGLDVPCRCTEKAD